jgi:hypothetical protein
MQNKYWPADAAEMDLRVSLLNEPILADAVELHLVRCLLHSTLPEVQLRKRGVYQRPQ